MEEQKFLESEWDHCIILDACRYDVFSDLYDEYLEGALEKRWSTGSATPEWAYRTFTDTHDIAYFSANPFINALDTPLNELKWGASCDYDWTAADHLDTVIDVWKTGWDDDLGTVPPKSLATAYRDHHDAVEQAERTVLHYMQPHAPYLSRGTGQKLQQIQKGIRTQDETNDSHSNSPSPLTAITETVRPPLERVLERSELAQKAGLWLELDPVDLVTRGTRDAAFELYEENLRIVLESVAELIPELDGRVVVTADHGEAFGESGVWEHHIETHIPVLMEVPWLEVR